VAAGGTRRFSVATRVTGRRGFTVFGASTSMFGSATAPLSAEEGAVAAAGACDGAAACDGAGEVTGAGAGVWARA
jgi:hypothetical protein